MTDALDARRLARVVRQHARTSQLLGVDFVPIGRAIAHDAPTTPAAAPPPAPKPATPPASSVRDEPPPPARTPSPAPPRVPTSSPPVEPPPREGRSRERAQKLLDQIRERYERDAPHQHFVTDHHSIVFGEGDPCARLMIIGEAPGAEEDRCGRPFVGKAGQLLDKMLGAMGVPRETVYITNVLKTRPPNNATPTSDEAALCAPYLFDQIRAISPEVILTLGLPATRLLLNTTESMGRLRGRWWEFRDPRDPGFTVPLMPTYHPAFLLRSYTRENRQKVWSDLQMVMERLGIVPAAGSQQV